MAKRVTERSGRELVSVWGSKRNAGVSSIAVAEAKLTAGQQLSECSLTVRTSAAADSTAYKQQIRDQLVGAVELGDGPVSMQLSFSVGERRNWLNLRKATIDALDPILGRTIPQRSWHPRDGRIVELGLHRSVEPTLNNDVVISISATVVA